jgi:hypothetical protein
VRVVQVPTNFYLLLLLLLLLFDFTVFALRVQCLVEKMRQY